MTPYLVLVFEEEFPDDRRGGPKGDKDKGEAAYKGQ